MNSKTSNSNAIMLRQKHWLADVHDEQNKLLQKHSRNETLVPKYSPVQQLKYNTSITLSSDQKWMTINSDSLISLWSTEQSHFIRSFDVKSSFPTGGHRGKVAFVKSDTLLLVRISERVIQCYDISTGVPGPQTAPFPEAIKSVSATIDPGHAIAIASDGRVYYLKVPSLEIVWQIPCPFTGFRTFNPAQFFEVGERLILWASGAGFAELDRRDGSLLLAQEVSDLTYCGGLESDRILLETCNTLYNDATYSHWEQTLEPGLKSPRLIRDGVSSPIWTHLNSPAAYLVTGTETYSSGTATLDLTLHSWDNGAPLVELKKFPFNQDLHIPLFSNENVRNAVDAGDAEKVREVFRQFNTSSLYDYDFKSDGNQRQRNNPHSTACDSHLAIVAFRTGSEISCSPYLECYDLESGSCTCQVRLQSSKLSSQQTMSLSPDGRYLAIMDQGPRLFDTRSGEEISEHFEEYRLFQSWYPDFTVGFDATSEYLLSSNGKETSIFHLASNTKIHSVPYGLVASGNLFAMSSHRDILISVDEGDLAVYNIDTKKIFGLSPLKSNVKQATFSPNEQYIAFIEERASTYDCVLVLCDRGTFSRLGEALVPLTHVHSIHIHPNNKEIWLVGWSVSPMKDKIVVLTLPKLEPSSQLEIPINKQTELGIGFVHGGKRFLAQHSHKSVEVWDPESKKLSAYFHYTAESPTWMLQDGSNHFWTDDTSRIAVLKKDKNNPDDPGEIISGEERETFLKQHNKRELVMAAACGGPAYDKFLAVKSQLKQNQALEDLTFVPKLPK